MNDSVSIHHHFHRRAFKFALILLIANSWQCGVSAEQLNGLVQTEDNYTTRLPRPKDHALWSLESPPSSTFVIQAPVQSDSLAREKDKRPHFYNVHWAKWEARVDKAIWANIPDGVLVAGGTCVQYAVTSDRHIHITFVKTPDPTGFSFTHLIPAIMRLDGSPLLDFPPGSEQLVHHSWNGEIGDPSSIERIGHFRFLVHPQADFERVAQRPLVDAVSSNR